MADQTAINVVLIQLPEVATDLGFNETVIGGLLDSGQSDTKVILAGWQMVAAKAATMGDVSESSSSRSNPLFDRAQLMIPIWQARADKEDLAAGANVRQRGASRTAVRV